MHPLRSLTVRLTIAMGVVGLVGAVLVAALVGQQTRTQFDRYVSSRDQTALLEALRDHYAERGGWGGVDAYLEATSPLNFYSRDVAIADASGVVVRATRDFRLGTQAPPSAIGQGVAIRDGDTLLGYLLRPPPRASGPPGRPDPASLFLQEVTRASALSAAIAAALALLIGVLLARTLTRPLRELTAATKALARGDLGHAVVVRGHDEIGQLASSFNQMSADLARGTQLRQQMTADLAHDLRTPLSILRGYTEGLQDGRLTGSPALFQIMHGEVVHLQRLVDDLRLLSLADAGALALNSRAVDPRALLERTALAYVVQAEEKQVALQVEAPEDLPSIRVDTDRLTQVLNNLVSNALRYTPAGGTIALAADAAPEGVVLRVRDTGSGIAPEDLPFVFERFYRADKSRTRADSSASGLGLAITKAIVEAHGGTVRADSVVGQGTTFTIALPVARESHTLPMPSS